jgi:hypothetical protein
MKMRMIKLNPDFLLQTLQGKAEPFTCNLPSDVELLDIKYDLFAKQVFAIVRSDSFENVADAHPTPELNVTYKTAKVEAKHKAKSTSTVKRSTVPASSLKAESAPTTKASTPKSQTVKAVEEEFSPEQRKLLSFTADGNYVIIKPTEYLKAEWDEINEVVRSLGGRWIKGDFFSFWEIPPQ